MANMRALDGLIRRYPDLENSQADIGCAIEILVQSYRQGGKLLVCGNGGSAADSEHIVGELMKGYLSRRSLTADLRRKFETTFPQDGAYLAEHLQGALPAISLVSQVSLITAFANDVAPDMIFAQQVYGYGRPGDVLIGISTSGSSRNVTNALKVARLLGLRTIGFTGAGGGEFTGLCDVVVCVPYAQTAEVQECHQAIYHAVCAQLEEEFFPA
jgi:D-sedoheptulose 7-phosphate isomerase